MKLLAFVLLGFLAHSCSGTYQTSQKVFQDHLCDGFGKNFEKYDNCNLLPFGVLNFGQVDTTVTGFGSLHITITYQSNNLYTLVIEVTVNVNCPGIEGLSLSIHVAGQLGVAVNEGCLEASLIEGSLEINIQVAKQAVFVGIGGALGGLTGGLTESIKTTIINSFTSGCQPLLQGKILEIIQTSLASFNTKNRDITTPVYRYGSWINLEISEIECTADSIVQYVDVAIKTTADAVATKVRLGDDQPTDLAEGVASSICFAQYFIDSFLNVVIDNIIPTWKKTLTNAEWQQYGVYPGIEGEFTVSVEITSGPSCNIQSSGSSVSISVEVKISDSTARTFLKVSLDLNIVLNFYRSNGQTVLSLGEYSISNKYVSTKDDGCGCGGDAELIESIEDVIGETTSEVITAVTGALNQGIPCVDSLTQTWPLESECFPVNDQVFQCSCNEY